MKKSILDITVSLFSSYKCTEPKSVNLLKWLNSKKLEKEVNIIRSTMDEVHRKKLKSELPAITPSGVFEKRNANQLIKHSGFIQFDIDLKDNTHISNFLTLKEQLCKIKEIAYCGLSVSGNGYWGLVPISDTESHKEHFEALYDAFLSIGIVIDKSCKDVCRLRGYSIDRNAYFNHNASIFNVKNETLQKPTKLKKKSDFMDFISAETNVKSKVEKCLNIIQQKQIDITYNYEEWFMIGCSIANEFKEGGRDYFHLISNQSSKYNFQTTDQQYTHCLKNKYNYSIGTFFHYCKINGISD